MKHYSLGTIFLPADHYIGFGVSGNYFDSRIAQEGSETYLGLKWRYGPVLSYTNSIYVREDVFITSSLSYSAYISESRRNIDGEGYIWLDERNEYINSDFQFFDASFGVGVNMKMNNMTIPIELRYSYHDLYFGTFYGFVFLDDGSKVFTYNGDKRYKYKGAGRSIGINISIIFEKNQDQKLFPYFKYNFLDTTHLDEYSPDNIYRYEYFLDERWEVGIMYDFRNFNIIL